jgi:hypothetical protein
VLPAHSAAAAVVHVTVAVSPLGMSLETTDPDTKVVDTGFVSTIWQTLRTSVSMPTVPDGAST